MIWRPSKIGVMVTLFGAFFAVCEVYGTYDYFIAQQGGLDYVVLLGCGIAASLPFLPPFADAAGRRGWRGLARSLWLALPLSLLVVMMAALQRTGAGTDEAEKDRAKGRAALKLAQQTKAEAEAEIRKLGTVRAIADIQTDLARAKLSPTYDRSGKCTEATAKASREFCATVASLEGEERKAKELDKHQKALSEARVKIASGSGGNVDSLASRISGYTGGTVSEEQVRLWQPLFIPILASWLSAAFLTLGMRMDLHSAADQSANCRLLGDAPEPREAAPVVRPPEPRREPPPPPPAPEARPASNVVNMPSKAAMPKIDPKPIISYMAANVPEARGENAEWGEMLLGFRRWCAQQEPPIAPMDAEAFGLALAAICEKADIRVLDRNGRVYCVGRKIVA
jgi:hypothetical protein